AVLAVQRKPHAQALRDARVGLPDLALRRDAEQHQRHRPHGYDDDDREEKKQAAAKAHSSMGRAERLPAHPLPKAPMGQLFEARGRLPAATMDCPRRDQAPLGAIAQLGERLDRTQEVGGSSPPSSISRRPANARLFSCRRTTVPVDNSPWSSFGQIPRAPGLIATQEVGGSSRLAPSREGQAEMLAALRALTPSKPDGLPLAETATVAKPKPRRT